MMDAASWDQMAVCRVLNSGKTRHIMSKPAVALMQISDSRK